MKRMILICLMVVMLVWGGGASTDHTYHIIPINESVNVTPTPSPTPSPVQPTNSGGGDGGYVAPSPSPTVTPTATPTPSPTILPTASPTVTPSQIFGDSGDLTSQPTTQKMPGFGIVHVLFILIVVSKVEEK